MKITYEVDSEDITVLTEFYESMKHDGLVQHRIENNINNRPRHISEEVFWKSLVK